MDYRKFCKTLIRECRKQRRIIRSMRRNGKPRSVYIEIFHSTVSRSSHSINLIITDPTCNEKKLAKRIAGFLNFAYAVGDKLAAEKGGDSTPPPPEATDG